MLFYVVSSKDEVEASPNCGYLVKDNWDDWGKFSTQYYLYICDADGSLHGVGSVKIGETHLKARGSGEFEEGFRTPNLPERFENLEDTFFSVGQNDDYYALIGREDELRDTVFIALRDCVYSPDIYTRYKDEYVMTESLLRSVRHNRMETTFHHLAQGNDALTRFKFTYSFPPQFGCDALLSFYVAPYSLPPSNVHAIIGSNGVGKTHFLHSLVNAILCPTEADSRYGKVEEVGLGGMFSLPGFSGDPIFKNILFISFSAFDKPFFPEQKNVNIHFKHIGPADVQQQEIDLKTNFTTLFDLCSEGLKKQRLLYALDILRADPLLPVDRIIDLLDFKTGDEKDNRVGALYSQLSSGHAIVFYTILNIAYFIEERSLIIFDEPESHLHPPLLATLIRCLSDQLIRKNGVAILATHSPVVLQEIPKNCVWKLYRVGNITSVARPTIETFGENVSTLTHEVFGLEVRKSGFYSILEAEMNKSAWHGGPRTYEDVKTEFYGLGSEAKAILLALYATWEPIE